MASKHDEIDLSRITTIGIGDRVSKVTIDDFGEPVKGGKAYAKWLKSLPNQLAVKGLRDLVRALRKASSSRHQQIVWMIGAHVIKCGLSRYLIELMKKRYVTAVAMNGAALIHDLEIAAFGETSEDVPLGLERGQFGFARETAAKCFEAVAALPEQESGLGESLGRYILKGEQPYRQYSVLAQAYRLELPATVHIAVGTDIIHQHPGFDGALWGRLSARDFRIFARCVEQLGTHGGVVINLGSAVILPEVFLKAFSIARNLGATFEKITACNMDMTLHYRPNENVLRRPTAFGGTSISLTGHHEIMVPVLYASLFS